MNRTHVHMCVHVCQYSMRVNVFVYIPFYFFTFCLFIYGVLIVMTFSYLCIYCKPHQILKMVKEATNLYKDNMMKQEAQGSSPLTRAGGFMVSRTKAASFFQYVPNIESLRQHKLYNILRVFSYHSFALTFIFHLLKCLNIFP